MKKNVGIGYGSRPLVGSLWIEAERHAALRTMSLPVPRPGQAIVRARWSGISRGTERIVFEGCVPKSEHERMRCPHQEGSFPFPIKYGYALVGEREDAPGGDKASAVFVLHPHQERICVDEGALYPLPSAVPPRRAILAANMETALNAVWDAGAGPGDNVLVVGLGVIGLLTAYVTARIIGTTVTAVDINPARADVANKLGVRFAENANAPTEQDVVFHASASAAGLALSLRCAGQDATVVELSWYGDRLVEVPFGTYFHSRRLRLISSQVGSLPPDRAPRWSHARRLRAALSLLAAPDLDALITSEIAFADLPKQLPSILAADGSGLMTAVRYGD